MKLRTHGQEKPLSGLIDATAERDIEQKFGRSLEMLNRFRTNLLEEHPQFAQNEALIQEFIQNSKVRAGGKRQLACMAIVSLRLVGCVDVSPCLASSIVIIPRGAAEYNAVDID